MWNRIRYHTVKAKEYPEEVSLFQKGYLLGSPYNIEPSWSSLCTSSQVIFFHSGVIHGGESIRVQQHTDEGAEGRWLLIQMSTLLVFLQNDKFLLQHTPTVESWFFEPSSETKIRWKNRRVGEIGDRIIVLVRVIRSFDKMRVREIIHSIFSKFCDLKKKKVLFALIIKMWTLFARAFINVNSSCWVLCRERNCSHVSSSHTHLLEQRRFLTSFNLLLDCRTYWRQKSI